MPARRADPGTWPVLTFLLSVGILLSGSVHAQQTGSMPVALAPGPGDALVSAHCGACHSLNLVTQNRGDRAHWQKLIRWMQAEHNLWDLGAAEEPVLDYLATHYGAPELVPRRTPLAPEWRDPAQ